MLNGFTDPTVIATILAALIGGGITVSLYLHKQHKQQRETQRESAVKLLETATIAVSGMADVFEQGGIPYRYGHVLESLLLDENNNFEARLEPYLSNTKGEFQKLLKLLDRARKIDAVIVEELEKELEENPEEDPELKSVKLKALRPELEKLVHDLQRTAGDLEAAKAKV